MPIRINLLAESRAAEEMRRRDPVKRGAVLGGVLVLACLGWAGVVAVSVSVARSTLASQQAAIATKTNAYQRVVAEQQALIRTRGRLTALARLADARFLQGNLLNALQHATVNDVQLTQLQLEQTYSLIEGPHGHTNDNHVCENILLRLTARDSSPNPGDGVNRFQNAIAHESYFAAMLSRTNAVQLAAPPSAVQTDSDRPYVTFVLNCRFAEHVR
ncbi:MAG TPA: hypothetical protein VFB55_12675 [Verrucomicrobiae bacterium]|nr:hypothetical protein [Verrucomicrobiae bacterium]